MQDTADSYPNESLHSATPSESYTHLPLSKSTIKHLSASAHLYPIDETEDFHDPFSDLSLFLSKKIKSEVEKHGSSKQWSHKIQQDLLAGILPEFKIKFPKYRIGIAAIKKVWEKVSYYYGKIQAHQDALQSDGKLNVAFMIKENLRGYPFAATAQLPHYNTAHQVAVKISECIAALEGTRPRLDRLTKTVWAAQKHLITDLPAQKSKNVYEDYDHIDKLIIKLILETTASEPLLSQEELEHKVKRKLFYIKDLSKKYSQEALYHHLAVLLSKHLYPALSLHHLLSSEERQKLRTFIETQLTLAPPPKNHGDAALQVETAQRILALYPLASSLPTSLSHQSIQEAIRYVYAKVTNRPLPHCPQVPQGVLTFIHAEMHFLKRKEEFAQSSKVEAIIGATLMTAQGLPIWREDYADELEVLVWHIYHEKNSVLPPETDFFEYEIENFLIDFPKHAFKNTVYQILNFFKKAQESLSRKSVEEESALWEEIDHKIYLWTIQNDMLCRWIHFDPHLALLKIIKTLWALHKHDETKVHHTHFIQEVFDVFTQTTPCMHLNAHLLRTRISLLYKYFWYHDLSAADESSLDRFVKWHLQDIRHQHKGHLVEEQKTLLEYRVAKLLPLTPLSKRLLEKLF